MQTKNTTQKKMRHMFASCHACIAHLCVCAHARTSFALRRIRERQQIIVARKIVASLSVKSGRSLLSLIIAKISNVQITKFLRKRIFNFKFWGIIPKNRIEDHIFSLWPISSLGSNLTLKEKTENFPVSFARKRALSCIIAKISNVQITNFLRKRIFNFKLWGIISKNRIEDHIFSLWPISSLGSHLTLKTKIENFPVSFGRKRAFYQLICKIGSISNFEGSYQKNQIEDHIFSLWPISSLGSHLTLKKKIENFPVSFGRKRAFYQLSCKIGSISNFEGSYQKIESKTIFFLCDQTHH